MLGVGQLTGFLAFTPESAPPPAGIIQSIQPFSITIGTGATSNTATITSVDTTKAVIFFGGFTTTGTTFREIMPRVELTNGTTVTAYRDTSSASQTVTAYGTVVEFVPSAVDSIQRGTITVASSATSGTATISGVTTSRSAAFYLGLTNSTTTTSAQTVLCRVELTDATTVSAFRSSASAAVLTVGYCVVEFASGVTASVQQQAPALTGTGASSTDTISSVTPGNTILLYQGSQCTSSTMNAQLYDLTLTDATTVTLHRGATTTTSRTIGYTALEFTSGKINSLQRGTLAVASATSADATISAVNTAKTVGNWVGFSTNASTNNERLAAAKLQDSTHVRGLKNTAGSSTSTIGYEAIEFA